METSAYIAKVLGGFLTVIAVALILNHKNLNTMFDLMKGKGYLFISGLVNLAIGLLIVLNHNIWVADWRFVVTLIGWTAVVKGVIRLVKPEFAKSNILFVKKNKNLTNVLFVTIAALGLYLLYVGFTTPMNSFF